MIRSIAVTFIAGTQEETRAEADELFTKLFGDGRYAVGGIEVTPFELSDTRPLTDEKGKVIPLEHGGGFIRDTLSWQGTYAAHPISRKIA